MPLDSAGFKRPDREKMAEAYRLIARGWCQCLWQSKGDIRMCGQMAIATAWGTHYLEETKRLPVCKMVLATAEKHMGRSFVDVPGFNDDPETTQEIVLRVFADVHAELGGDPADLAGVTVVTHEHPGN